MFESFYFVLVALDNVRAINTKDKRDIPSFNELRKSTGQYKGSTLF